MIPPIGQTERNLKNGLPVSPALEILLLNLSVGYIWPKESYWH
jgi:hypothetical protein